MAPAISTPVGPPPTTTNVRRRARSASVLLGLGLLERQQDTATQIGGVVDGLQPGRRVSPVVMTEVGVLCAGRDDEIVIGNAVAFGLHFTAGRVDP